MRNFPLFLAGMALLAGPALAQPPREESPAPRENLESFGAGSSDDELARAIAAAGAYPLGSLQNPIRMAGPDGANAYLARLRCADGTIPKTIGRSSDTGGYGSVVDVVSLDCGSAAPGRVALAIDIYHEEHVETRLPPGFTARP